MVAKKCFSRKLNKFNIIAVLACLNIALIVWTGTFHSSKWVIMKHFTTQLKRNSSSSTEAAEFSRNTISHPSYHNLENETTMSRNENETTMSRKENETTMSRKENDSNSIQHVIRTEIRTQNMLKSTSTGNNNPPANYNSKCPDILSEMTRGKWIRRNLTIDEQAKVDAYLRDERGAYNIPPTFQRSDGRCGDVPYEHSPLYRHMWFKAICNPKGSTPCCRHNRCVSLSVEQCLCAECYDERPAIHSEFAKWQPEEAACEVHNHSTSEACQLLKGSTISFLGDSFIRHIFVSLVILLTGNPKDGALERDLTSYERRKCSGWHQMTGNICRQLLIEQRSLCGGTVQVDYTEIFRAEQLPLTVPIVHAHSRAKGKKSLIVLGLGIHDDFQIDDVTNIFLKPFLNIHQFWRHRLQDITSVVNAVKSFKFKKRVNTNYNLNLENFVQKNKINDIYFDSLRRKPNNGNNSNNKNNPSGNYFNFLDLPYDRLHIQKMEIKLKTNLVMNENSEIYNSTIIKSQPVSTSNLSQNSTLMLSNPTPDTKLYSHLTNSKTQTQTSNLLWLGNHAPGVLKSPKFIRQSPAGVTSFNQETYKILKQWNVPYLDTFSFTAGTVSFDGAHYGWGINMLKMNMILTYIKDTL